MPFWHAVLKVGGSLIDSAALPGIMRTLAAAARHQRILVVPGGGPFADAVRQIWRRKRFGMRAAHRMAILGMDQYGLLLCERAARASPAATLSQARRLARSGRLPVLLASRLAASSRELPASWNVTSDSIAAWVASRVGARRLILVKSVYPPRSSSPRALAARGIVDQAFPRFARATVSCRVINGRADESGRRLKECLMALERAGERRHPR